ncbi:inner membrane protein [Parvibaculum lavamentivorans DS-1]|uniref:Inner membrane protein n=1 Tax=Parvibaculum lavamentivorans (strain DS-1 / DSM 13023 / NCIMB 13966) TaxID=402881 RepID=A7HV26_PARL1|nr:MAPEG family protein [Parvibaculum lavamentivorans]ABS63759.1 inner membrane protein [Parvibaculum lavamentivorans DS-1]
MTMELWSLVWGGVLLFILILLSANANVSAMGMGWGIGNRDVPATTTGWGARARRAYINHLENLLIYASIAIPAHLVGVSTELSILGAQIFIIARILYAIVYVAGWTVAGIRTICWLGGVIGYALIFIALLQNT